MVGRARGPHAVNFICFIRLPVQRSNKAEREDPKTRRIQCISWLFNKDVNSKFNTPQTGTATNPSNIKERDFESEG